jgi:hypothetical protein
MDTNNGLDEVTFCKFGRVEDSCMVCEAQVELAKETAIPDDLYQKMQHVMRRLTKWAWLVRSSLPWKI